MVKIMIPVKENKGRDSIPSDTLGGAPHYYIVDTEGDVSTDRVVDNGSKQFGGTEVPIRFVVRQDTEVIFTREACKAALKQMNYANITPYEVGEEKASELLIKYENNRLNLFTESNSH